MLDILSYFSSIEFYYFALILIIIGAITQSAIGIGFGIPACFLVLFSYRDILKKDLIYSFSGRIVGTLISVPLISLTIGTKSFLIIFGVLLLITVFLSAKKWNL